MRHGADVTIRFTGVFPLFLIINLFCTVTEAKCGEPEIVLMWQVQKDAAGSELELLSKAGVNTIQSFSMSSLTDGEIALYLDKAKKHDLKVAAYLGHLFERTGASEKCGARCEDFIKKWKDHPAVFLWHIIDEPSMPGKKLNRSDQEEIYRKIKSLDPDRPVMVSASFTSQASYDDFFSEEAFDVFEMHAYVDPRIGKRQRRLMDLFKKNRKRADYPVVITLRAFNGPGWEDLGPGSLQEQFDFFIRDGAVTDNFGFYGWKLSPNSGIRDIKYIEEQFLNLRK